jgi:DNA-binding transcriptional ArsR family regulator
MKNNTPKLLTLALSNKQIATAIVGQALLDEGGIGTSGITVFYTNENEAKQLWTIADSLGYANPFRKKKHRNHCHYGFSIKAGKIKELYDEIGPLPNPTKDRIFRHLMARYPNIHLRQKGETKRLILKSLNRKPKTVLDLILELDISGSTARKQLNALKRQHLVKICGYNRKAFQKSRRTAYLWVATQDLNAASKHSSS